MGSNTGWVQQREVPDNDYEVVMRGKGSIMGLMYFY